MIDCRMLSRLFALASVVSIAGAGYLYLRAARGAAGLVVEEPARAFKGLTPGCVYEIKFRVHNQTGATQRVVGGPGFA